MLAVLCAFVGCGNGEERLDLLRTDPMASYALPSAVDTRTNENAGGTSLGISSPAWIRNTFTVPAGGAADAVAEIADAATDAGWTLRPRELNGFSDDKRIDGVFAQILIGGIEQDDTVWVEVSSRDN
jgi:hypothetical protein